MKRFSTAIFFAFLAVGCSSRPYMTINGEVITVKQFNEAMKEYMPPKEERYPGIEEQVKVYVEDQLIRKTVISQLQKEYNVELSEKEIDQIYNFFVLVVRRYPTLAIAEELFPYYENGKSKEEIRKMVAETLFQNKIIEAIYGDEYQKATEDQIKAWYDSKKEQFTIPKSYYVSQIYIDKPKEIVEEIEEVKIESDEDETDVEIEETVVEKETEAQKLYNELEALLPKLTSEKAFMKSAAKYMKKNPYFDKNDYKANRGFIYVTEETKVIEELLQDVPVNGVSAVYDYTDYDAYMIFYVYDVIPEHTIELDQIYSFAAVDTGMEYNRNLYEKFHHEKIQQAKVVYNEADRLAAKEEIQLEDEEIDLPVEDEPVVEDGIVDSMTDGKNASETAAVEE